MKDVPLKVSPFFLLGLAVVYMLGIFVLASTLFRVQVTNVAEFREDQQSQVTRRIQVPGLRGRILDCKGRVLAECRPSRSIQCNLEEFQRSGNWSNTVNAVDKEIDRLAQVLQLPRTVTREKLERHIRRSCAMPLTVWYDLDDEKFARFSERATDFPGFSVDVRAERVYPYGSLAAHLLGYTGRDKPETETGDTVYHYYETDLKGRAGLEGFYNRFLAGATGEEKIHVDARGFKPKKERASMLPKDSNSMRKPTDGLDLVLTIDAAVQSVLERELRGHVGAGVVIDPRSGAVLALASSPTFDPNDFVPFLPHKKYKELSDDPKIPLLNRAITGTYAPGSTFKPITALAALKAGWEADKELDCLGIYVLGNLRLHCWDRYGHGPISMRMAIEQSCNPFFCHIGYTAGTNAVMEAAKEFGLASRTGIDIGGEAAGAVPGDEWKRAHYDERWYPGDTCQMSIGQGMLLVTPLQMAVVAAALGNKGKIYTPYLHQRIEGMPPPKPVRHLSFKAEDIETVRLGMRDVAEHGTGRRIAYRYVDNPSGGRDRRFKLNVSCAGKTGTAELGRGETRRKNTWVIAFAPYENPTVAVAMIVERGESGGKTVAPKVHSVLASIFGETEVKRNSRNGGFSRAEGGD